MALPHTCWSHITISSGRTLMRSVSALALAAVSLSAITPALATEAAPNEAAPNEAANEVAGISALTDTQIGIAIDGKGADRTIDAATNSALNTGPLNTGPAADQPPAGQDAPSTVDDLALLQALATSVFAGDFVTVGLGVGVLPSYEGSDNYVLFPAPQIIGSVSGFQFSSAGAGPGLFVDVVRDSPTSQTNIIAGPLFRVNLNRTIQSQINDPVVEQLGDLAAAVEVGGRIGVAFSNVFAPFDALTFSTDVAFDVAGAHSGTIISPSVSYRRVIQQVAIVNFSLSADWVDDDYAQFYYGVDAAGSAASGLPVFDAGGGFKAVSANLVGAYDLSGNALDGGWSVFGLLGYSRLREAAAATPITAIRGDANQGRAALGLSYTF